MFGIADAVRYDLQRNKLIKALRHAQANIERYREQIIRQHSLTNFAFAALELAVRDDKLPIHTNHYLNGYNWIEHGNDRFVQDLYIKSLVRYRVHYNKPELRDRIYLTTTGEEINKRIKWLYQKRKQIEKEITDLESQYRPISSRLRDWKTTWKTRWAERNALPSLSGLLEAFKSNLEAAERIQQVPLYVKPEDIEVIPLRNTWTVEQQREMNDLYWESDGLAFWLNPAGLLADATPAPEWWVKPERKLLNNPQPVEDVVALSLQPPEGYKVKAAKSEPYGFIPASPDEIAEKYHRKQKEYNSEMVIDEILKELDDFENEKTRKPRNDKCAYRDKQEREKKQIEAQLKALVQAENQYEAQMMKIKHEANAAAKKAELDRLKHAW